MRMMSGWAMAAMAMSIGAASAMPLAPIVNLPEAPSSGPRNLHRKINRSRYMPHQGKRECARRVRLMAKQGEGE